MNSASRTFVCACSLAGALAVTTAHAVQTYSVDEKAVLASFQVFLDGLAQRDEAAMLRVSMSGGTATLLRRDGPVQTSLKDLAERLAQPGSEPRQERIRDALVKVDGDLAMLWAPFEFTLNGKLNHCGIDTATLVRVAGNWQIASLADNNRTDCATRK